MRQPAIEKVLDIEVNSTATSIAPGTCSIGRRRVVVEIDLAIGEIGQDEDLVLLGEDDEVFVEIEIVATIAVGLEG